MLVLKLSAIVLAAVVCLSLTVGGVSVPNKGNGNAYGRDKDRDDIVLPTTAAQLFSDFYNNNSIALQLKAKQASYATPTIEKLAPGMYMSENFAMGNSLWVVTPQNTIVVFDTPESNEAAAVVRTQMRAQPEIGCKPITFIVYTIFQGDHTFGAQSYINDSCNNGQAPVIIGHKNLIQQAEFFDTFSFIKMNRVLKTFGILLPSTVGINTFPSLTLGAVQYLQYYPTILIDLENMGDTQDITLNGLQVQFVYIPGYTADQLAVWFPATKVLHCADIFYDMIPNIYTIRGEPARDAAAWAQTSRIAQSYNAEVMYTSHSYPVIGRDEINRLLEKNADVIQFIHDQTVRYLGKGYTPDEAWKFVNLPSTIKSEPRLGEFYGKIEGHSKSVADHYTGWFNGEAEDLLPVSKDDLAADMVREFGRNDLIEKARKAYKSGNYRWALTLATHVWRYENKSLNDALYWRTQSLKRLAETLTAAQWRNYLLTEAMVDWRVLPAPYLAATQIRSRPSYLKLHTLSNCFTLLSVHLNAQLADGVDVTIDLSVTDDANLQPGQVYRLRVRNAVLISNIVTGSDPLNPTSFPLFRTTNTAWRTVLAGGLTIDQALSTNAVSVVRGSSNDIKNFLALFDFVDQL